MGRADREQRKIDAHNAKADLFRQRQQDTRPVEVKPSEYLKLRAMYGNTIDHSRMLNNGNREVTFKRGKRPPDDWR